MPAAEELEELAELEELQELKDDIKDAVDALQDVQETVINAAEQIADALHRSGNETVYGTKTFAVAPVVPTLAAENNSDSAASTAFVKSAVSGVKTDAGAALQKATEAHGAAQAAQTAANTAQNTAEDALADAAEAGTAAEAAQATANAALAKANGIDGLEDVAAQAEAAKAKALEALDAANNAIDLIGTSTPEGYTELVATVAANTATATAAGTAAQTAQGTADAVKAVVDAAKARGQVGDVPVLDDVDYDTLVDSGTYRITMSSGMAKHQPVKMNTASLLYVSSGQGIIYQTLLDSYNGQLWIRRRGNDNTWRPWIPVHGSQTSLTVYVSKSGSDTNTGLESAYPVATIGRAVQIGLGLLQGANSTPNLVLHMGPGEWGDVSFRSLPFCVYIKPYDGQAPTAFSTDLPTFSNIRPYGMQMHIGGVNVKNVLNAGRSSHISLGPCYNRIGRLEAGDNGVITVVNQDAASNLLELGMQGSPLIRAYKGGRIDLEGNIHIKLAMDVTYAYGLVYLSQGGVFSCVHWKLAIDSSIYTFTGPKYHIEPGGIVLTGQDVPNPAVMDSLPGTQAGVYDKGANINGFVIGQTSTPTAQAMIAAAATGSSPASLSSLTQAAQVTGENMARLAAMDDHVETAADNPAASMASLASEDIVANVVTPVVTLDEDQVDNPDNPDNPDNLYMPDIADIPDMPDIPAAPAAPTLEELMASLRIERDIRLMACDANVNRLSRKIRRSTDAAEKEILSQAIDMWDTYAEALCDFTEFEGSPWDGGGPMTPWPPRPDQTENMGYCEE